MFRYSIATLLVVTLLVALSVKFSPVVFSEKEEAAGYKFIGSGSYFWLDNTRSLMPTRDLRLSSFLANSQNGNLVWIEYAFSQIRPKILRPWSGRKILIQLPHQVSHGDTFDFNIQETSGTGLKPNRFDSEMPICVASVYLFDKPPVPNWFPDSQQFATGKLKIIKMTPTTVTISLDLPEHATLRSEMGDLPEVLTLTRRQPNAR